MYAGRIICRPLMSLGEYTNGTDKLTDGWTPDVTLCFPLEADNIINKTDKKQQR